MKNHLDAALAIGSAWLATAFAVAVGIYYTHSIHCLWFMIIPLCLRIKSVEKTQSNNKEKEDN